jgi:hypothetical protein
VSILPKNTGMQKTGIKISEDIKTNFSFPKDSLEPIDHFTYLKEKAIKKTGIEPSNHQC